MSIVDHVDLLLLIEPLWNWNSHGSPCALPATMSFNRTTMELKRERVKVFWARSQHLLIEPLWNWNDHLRVKLRSGNKLLIEPLWNWNTAVRIRRSTSGMPFNRTTMELKHWRWSSDGKAKPSFNRTTMELKPKYESGNSMIALHPFNRTTMELKRWPRSLSMSRSRVF